VEWYSVVRDVVMIGLAFYGLSAWRREHAGKRRMELAEDAIALFYQAEEVIPGIRLPLAYSSESEGIVQQRGESPRHFSARNRVAHIFTRLQRSAEFFSKLHALRYRFMAQFGRESVQPFDAIREVVTEIKVTAECLIDLLEHPNGRDGLIKKEEAVIESCSKDDEISRRVAAAVSGIEQFCGPIIEETGSRNRGVDLF
jgi:hypothetical protein